jgi:hypothetical protein
MNNQTKIKVMALVAHDRGLLVLFSGIILTAVALISLVVTATVWFL